MWEVEGNVDQFLDLDNYTDYIIAQSWIADKDWPQNNIKAFRTETTGWRWQFVLIGLEWSFLPNEWSTTTFDHIEYLFGKGAEDGFSGFWVTMTENSEYLNRFINRYADLMNTSYSFSVTGSMEQKTYAEMFPEVDGQFERWGSANVSEQMEQFTENHEVFRSELEKRSRYAREHLRDHFDIGVEVIINLSINVLGTGDVNINSISPSSYPWSGQYFSDVPVQISAVPKPGYKFRREQNCIVGKR